MSTDFERFIAGEGRLAGMLRAQPGFEPPVGMEARLFAALETEETMAGFEPPAQLEAAVMAEAERLDAAQRARRDALLAAVVRGDDPSIHELGPAAQRWLRAQATTAPHATSASPRRARRWPWLAGAGGAVAAMLALGVAVQLWFDPQASRVAQESDAETAAAIAPASPAPPPAADAAQSPSAKALSQREAKRAGLALERSESSVRPPAMAAQEDSTQPVGNTAAQLARAKPSPAEAAPARDRQHAPRDASRALLLERAEHGAPRMPSAIDASPPPSQGAATAGRASAARETFAEAAPATPMASAVAPEPEAMRPDDTERRAGHDAVRFSLPVTTPASSLVARIAAHPPQRWQFSVAPADRPAAEALIGAALRQLAEKGRSDRFVLIVASRATGTLEVKSQD